MARVGLVLDPCFERHDTGPGHPEAPVRLESVRSHLAGTGLVDRCAGVDVEEVGDETLAAVHDRTYMDRLIRVCESGEQFLDSLDTAVCPESEKIARLAAGAMVALGREVAEGNLDRGFAAVRPPGHHAERDLSMGFCLYNNVAVAARHLQAVHDLSRVLIVDWDVHHGNGTQHLFEDDPSVLYFSVHQMPLYPGTGAKFEKGVGPGTGATINRPLPPGAGDDEFLRVLGEDLVAAADAFRPEFVLVSAGFDAHRSDPLAGLQVTTGGFAEATRIVAGIADRHASGRLVSGLEGGYDVGALAESVEAHLRVLLEG